jgi:hypothetical protein
MNPGPVRRKKKKKGRSPIQKYWWLAPVLAVVGMILYVASGPKWSRARIETPKGPPVTGYLTDSKVLALEYKRFYGKALNDAEVEKGFEMAAQSVAAKDFSGAAGFLEHVARGAAVPAVFNNLGVLYAALNDQSRAANAFREALTRDADYQPVRRNLDRLKDVMALSTDLVSREFEPNNTLSSANMMATGKPVDGTIEGLPDDLDTFRITTPPAPRDLISIEITSRSATLAPVLKIYDADSRITDLGKSVREAGSNLQKTIAPLPNTTLYLQVSGYDGSTGGYTLLVRARKEFDTYEPNDDIFNAPRVALGTTISAGIMDDGDTDFFSFVSLRNGTVSFKLTNRSTTLIPALSTFGPDQRSSGFGPDVRIPGANLRHTLEVLANQTYYIQIWSQGNTAGAYSFIIE